MDDSISDKRGVAIKTKHFTIKDHNDDEVSIAWCPENSRKDILPPFPFQVYLLSSAERLAKDVNFPCDFAAFVQKIGPVHQTGRCHFQVYRRTFPNILACIAHQKQEILYRNRNGISPRMIARWAQSATLAQEEYIVVIDANTWADDGILLVKFDPVEYGNPGQYANWNVALSGDTDVVQARRAHDTTTVINTLGRWWQNAGGHWTEEDLQRRNEGGMSPVLYPAIDPAAHYDAEHEEVHELDGTALPGPAGQANENGGDDDDNEPRIIDTFDPFDLHMQEHELKEYCSESYSDILDLPVTSVWSRKLSRVRPQFSFTLYLAFDFFQVYPQALFRCLNKGLIAQEAWTLDIVMNMPSLDAAFQYHARATAQRTAKKCEQRRACVRLVLRTFAGSKLPSEILEQIENLLLPPVIPKYSARPCRPFKDVFLHLEKSHQYTGPLIIYSNPDIMQSNHDRKSLAELSQQFDRVVGRCALRVVYLRYWHRVADELHVLWSLCSPRCVMPANRSTPRAELELTTPEACVWRSQFGIQYINGYVDVKITFHSDREIVIPSHGGPFSHDLWNECVDTIDLETGEILPPKPPSSQNGKICMNSWAATRELGFGVSAGPDWHLDPDKIFRSFKANGSCVLKLRPEKLWWQLQVRNGVLKSGRRYAFRLKSGISIPRWTYGTRGHREGPFNLPPIPITVDETLRPFTFRVESVGAPHGSFNR